MPTLRQRLSRSIANTLLGDERARLENAITSLAEARQYTLRANHSKLEELDSQLIDLIIQQSGYTRLGGGGYGSIDRIFSETVRRNTVMDSRWMYQSDVQASAAVDMWTDFGFGQLVNIQCADKVLEEIFQEFWKAPRNAYVLAQDKIHENSTISITDGEVFFAIWASTLDGTCTIRRLTTDQISDIICDPTDPSVPVWYAQNTQDGKTICYADYRAAHAVSEAREAHAVIKSLRDEFADVQAINEAEFLAGVADSQVPAPLPQGAINADDLRPNTRVVIVPAQCNMIGKRGWPRMRQSLAWARAYGEFMGDRATVAKKAAMFVEKLRAKNSGQRQIDNIVERLQSSLVNEGSGLDRNQNTTAGQTWVENEQVSREWMTRDTGASAAQIDGLALLGQFAAGARVPLGWLGRPDAWQNRAVAKEASLPWYEQIQRYQTFWSTVFQNIVEVVGRFANEYGGKEIADFSCEVGLDSPFQNDIDEIVSLMGAITNAVKDGTLDVVIAERAIKELARLGLLSLGIRDTKKVLEPESPAETPAADNGMPELAREIKAAHKALRESLRALREYA